MLGDLLRFAGRIDDGLAAVADGFAHAERTLEGGYIAELHRARGQLLQAKGDLLGADGQLRLAIDYAVRQQAKAFELRAATALAGLLTSTGRHVDARSVLAPVYDWFTEGKTTMDLVAAETLLTRLI